ncbi:hypothetical protein M0R07_000313 [Escherichia coli]|nr:hypothetical protein [Escherichia coli]EJC8043590.1 hypothetical protein [Escherichia coli]HBE6514653.1 hypothetical protein [Escherichia coli]HDV2681561.1 hypothetical protein [Escherichia coli]
MARNVKYYNSDNSPVLVCTHERYSHAFKSEWFQHPPCTEEQAEWIISVRLPYSERPPRASRTFQQRIWR